MTAETIPFTSAGFEEMVVSIPQKASMLEKSQLAKGLEWAEIELLAAFIGMYTVSEGSIVCRQGDDAAFLSIVCRGRVDIVKESLGHHNKIIASIGPGYSLGEMSLIDGTPRSATAVAHTPVEMIVLTKEGYDKLSENFPRVWGKLLVNIACVLCRRLRQTSGILAEYLES